ncbi:polyadenylate-binding protein RBP45 isoform X2 [Dendrobium catenatum]|uniref:Polyadenylate-binding protein RBP45 n=2 Tax=Dendrobium catenatum TaxID=906689 RepID=A0A2I0X3C4_9ASPA|nr:polyadenylate-binding protein RBP45 isoform X2 [Dendrobium catenatum]PKU82418.1 Polyadenylate-binding protein RBP45 [Dendrobium catenatum]
MMQGGGMVPPSMDQQYQMHPPPQYQMPPPTQPVPPQWGTVPPPAPQPQYPPAQPIPMWSQQPAQIPPAQSMPPMQQPQQFQPQYGAPMQTLANVPFPAAQPQSADEIRTLWIGDLQYWMEESYISNCFAQSGEVVSVKLIRNKQTGQLESYGFIEFTSRAAAERVLQAYNGTLMPNSDQVFRLNWASAGGKKGDDAGDFTIFVGDLASDVTDFMLQEAFRSHYPSVKGAKLVTDRITGRSKGYGFVRFGDLSEQTRALTEMNGVYCSSRPMRVGQAASKRSTDGQQQDSTKASFQSVQGNNSESDPNNTTIFVGGLDPNATEDILRQIFSPHGELVHVKIPIGKRCGFVQFVNRASAEEALMMLQGTQLGGQKMRLSWGRSPNKQPQQDTNQWNGNYYGYGQGYEAYGYAQAPQDPNMYAYGNYPGYANYQQQQ